MNLFLSALFQSINVYDTMFLEEVLNKVSVIIPFYNQSEYIYDSVKSVLKSTYNDVEIIVVNDGSTDISFDDLSKLLPSEVKIINQENLGVCKARNIGISHAAGDYILPLDADDKIAPEYIEKAVSVLDNNSDVGIVYCEVEAFGAKTGILKQKPATIENMLVQNRIFPCSMFRKSDFLKTAGYRDEMVIGCEDWDLWLSLIENGAKPFKIPEVLFYYRKHENERTKRALSPINYLKIRLNIVRYHKNLYKNFGIKIYFLLAVMVFKNALSYSLRSLKTKVKF